MLQTASAPGHGDERLPLWAGWLALLFPLALLGFGLGFLRWRCAPALSGVLLALGGFLATWQALAPSHGLPLFADACVVLACGWIGLRLLRDPQAWVKAAL